MAYPLISGYLVRRIPKRVGVQTRLGEDKYTREIYFMTNDISGMNWLYIIASGNDDSVYKIGISVDPVKRLEQIKRDYDVPNAYIVETMDVPTREEVFAVENALHTKYDRYQSNAYEGREWFKLNKKQLKELIEMYQEQSNAFAQATAYYGLVEERAKLHDKAQEMEATRQMQITHNRRHGRRYDTKPKGYLKRYNELGVKLSSGVLGERFSLKGYEHPILGIVKDMTSEVKSEVEKLTKGFWWKLGAGGLLGGMLIAGASNSANVSPVAWLTAGFGAVGGGMTTAIRTKKETDLAEGELMADAKRRYPLQVDKKLYAIVDEKERRTFLVQGFKESTPQMRNQPAVLPSVPKPDSSHMLQKYRSKTYFPFTATAVTAFAALVLNSAFLPAEERSQSRYRSYLPLPPTTSIMVGRLS